MLYHFYDSSVWLEQLSNEELFRMTYSPLSVYVYRRCGYVLARRVWNKTGMNMFIHLPNERSKNMNHRWRV